MWNSAPIYSSTLRSSFPLRNSPARTANSSSIISPDLRFSLKQWLSKESAARLASSSSLLFDVQCLKFDFLPRRNQAFRSHWVSGVSAGECRALTSVSNRPPTLDYRAPRALSEVWSWSNAFHTSACWFAEFLSWINSSGGHQLYS